MRRRIDQAALRNRLAVIATGNESWDVFVRGYDAAIEHYWIRDGFAFGPEQLGGHFDTDPLVIGGGEHLQLIGRSGFEIVNWRWNSAQLGTWVGTPDVVTTLPGYCVGDPTLAFFDGLKVFATTAEGWVKIWAWQSENWELLLNLRSSIPRAPFVPPAVISFRPGILDMFSVSADGKLLHATNNGDVGNGQWTVKSRGGERLRGQPAVVSMEEGEVDVFVLDADGRPVHWAFNGNRWFDAEKDRIDDVDGTELEFKTWTHPENEAERFPRRLSVWVRTADDDIVPFAFEPPTSQGGLGGFRGVWDDMGGDVLRGAVFVDGIHDVTMLARNADGGFDLAAYNEDPRMAGEAALGGSSFFLDRDFESFELRDPEPPPVGLTLPPVDADLLMTRPRDLVLLGLRWEGFQIRTNVGAASELVPDGTGRLMVHFPPQHVVEQVVAPSFALPDDGSFTARSALSGASRIVVEVSGPEPVPLTVDGVLDALRRGRLLPGGSLEENTAIELPYRLIISPDVTAGEMRCHHAAASVESDSGTVGLWQTHIRADATAPTESAGLFLRPLAVDSADPFAVALGGGQRARVLIEEPTARIDRLSLSALGGTLSATGSWPGLSWEHEAALGRDRRVRVSTQGVMYPFGHRAEYIELTERNIVASADGAVAVLRKTRTLRITEPVRQEPDDARLRAAFPFGQVEFTTTVFDEVDNPDPDPGNDDPGNWETQPFDTDIRQQLEILKDRLTFDAKQRYEELFGDMGPGASSPAVEDLAFGFSPDGSEPFDPDDPESMTRAEAATGYLGMLADIRHVDAQMAALPFGGVADVPVFFVPKLNGAPINFPVRLAGRLADLHIATPMIFVADIDRKPGILAPAFNSLTDEGIATRLVETFKGLGDGEVDIGSARIDLVRSSTPAEADICEVLRLHIVGTPHQGGFRPRLGTAPPPGERKPASGSGRWAFDAVFPVLRTLLGTDQPPLRLTLTPELLASTPDLTVPFRAQEGDGPGENVLAITFAENTARSGGMAAPDIDVDGVSRAHGLVSVDGLLEPDFNGKLNPAKVLGQTASLLGYSLIDLIDRESLDHPPEMINVTRPGELPHAELRWRGIKLRNFDTFVPGPAGKLDLEVIMGASEQKVTCSVTDFVLALPKPEEESKLIEVSVAEIVFTQTGSVPASLSTRGVEARFFGPLKLLEKLGGAMKVGDTGPSVDVSPNGLTASYTLPVPDVKSGVFLLSGLIFHAAIDIPFDTRPVAISLGFASREKPFNLSVLMFGGGGYVDVLLDAKDGLRRLELALEFGASVAVDFVVASGEVHALGGARLVKNDAGFIWDAYLRFGGSVSILGLVSVSVELCLTLSYEDLGESSRLVGRATLVLEIDLTLFSESVELDSGEWELIGGGVPRPVGPPPPGPPPPGGGIQPSPAPPDVEVFAAHPRMDTTDHVLEQWRRYRSAFAEGSVR